MQGDSYDCFRNNRPDSPCARPDLFYTRKLFHKLRSLFILVLAFASAGLVGYSSASSIGIGWTVSLALFIFLGFAVTVIYLHRREDRQIEEHFELALKSEQPLSLGTIDAIPSELITASAPLPCTPEPKLLEIHQALPPIEEIEVENGEKSRCQSLGRVPWQLRL